MHRLLFLHYNSDTFNLTKPIRPIDYLHAVFCQQPVVEPEPDIKTSGKEEQQPEHITLSTQHNKQSHVKPA